MKNSKFDLDLKYGQLREQQVHDMFHNKKIWIHGSILFIMKHFLYFDIKITFRWILHGPALRRCIHVDVGTGECTD